MDILEDIYRRRPVAPAATTSIEPTRPLQHEVGESTFDFTGNISRILYESAVGGTEHETMVEERFEKDFERSAAHRCQA